MKQWNDNENNESNVERKWKQRRRNNEDSELMK